MSVLFMDGFDHYSVTTSLTFQNIDLSQTYVTQSTAWYNFFSYNVGYNNVGQCVTTNNSSSTANSVQLPTTSTPLTSFSIGGHIYLASLSNGTDIFTIQPQGSSNYIRVSSSSNERIIWLTVNGTTNQLQINDDIQPGVWFHLEVNGVVTGSNQIKVDIYINGMLNATWSGTGFTTTPYNWSLFYIGSRGGSGTPSRRYDNLFLTDGEVIGTVEIRPLVPNADTMQKDGFPLTGVGNFSQLNAVPSSMNSWVSLVNDTDTDKYEMSNLVLDNDYSIVAVQASAYAKSSTTPEIYNCDLILDSNGVEITATTSNMDQTYIRKVETEILENDPSTGTAWTMSGIDNLKIGIRNNS